MFTRPVRLLVGALSVLVMTLLLAGCGGNGDSTGPDQSESTAVAPQPTRTPSIFGATWTPVPSPVPLPRKTVAYTYVPPPTGSPVFLPTRAPTEIPPTFDPLAATAQAAAGMIQGGASSNTALLLSASMVNEEAATVLEPVIGSFIGAPPEITFEEDRVLVAMNVLVRGSDGTTRPRPVVIEASANPADDAIRLLKQEAYYTDDNTPYADPIGDFVLGSVDTALNNVLRERYRLSNPGGGAFTITRVQINENGLTVRTGTVAN